MATAPLPIRVARPAFAGLDYLNDEYFALLARCGYEAVYLQNSPFDDESGNVAQFFSDFHLISVYDLARSFERERLRDYVREVCLRAARHGLKTHLLLHEPRLPYYAWSSTPPSWRGRGGWPHDGGDAIAYCWSEPEAVAYWKSLAREAFAALPEIAGIMVGVMDNEAIPCDARCPRCKGEKSLAMVRDVLSTYAEIGRSRPGFRIALIDWWTAKEFLVEAIQGIDGDFLLVGHACAGQEQVIDGEKVPGTVGDMAMISGKSSAAFRERLDFYRSQGLRVVDRTPWSHGCENWFLPAPPDPRYAIEKLRSLREDGVEGWYDFDCAALEPGSIAEAVAAWVRRPDADPEELAAEALKAIFGDSWRSAQEAYALYEKGKNHFPVAWNDPEGTSFSGRCVALTVALAGPYFLEDFAYFDTRHAFNWFAPYNLVTRPAVRYLTPHVAKAAMITGQAFAAIARVPVRSPAMRREHDAFEIHHRQYRAMASYLRLAELKLDWLEKRLPDGDFERGVRELAAGELENHTGLELWLARNPGKLDNPNHDLLGKLEEMWPGLDFRFDLLLPRRRSLEKLCHYRIGPPLPLRRRL